MQQLEQAAAVLRYHSKNSWDGHSEVDEIQGSGVQIVIRVGSPTEPAYVILSVSATHQRPVVSVGRHFDGTSMQPLGWLTDLTVLAKLGGTLIQVSNIVDQLIVLGADNEADA